MKHPSLALGGAVLLAGGALLAGQLGLRLHSVWLPVAPPGAAAHAAYFTLENPTDAEWRVVGVEVEGFARAELHETRLDGDRARMRPVPVLVLAPGARLVAEPGGLHAMLFGAARAPAPGMRPRLTLVFASGERLSAPAEVRSARDGDDDHTHHH